jgi:peroxiredoxin Q/BCP
MKSALFLSFIALMTTALVCLAEETKLPKVGDLAPKVQGKAQDNKAWKLEDALKGKNVLLYFYPKDDTAGCTKEACGLRDRMGDVNKANVEVVGVSFDDTESHKAFIAKYNLNFKLLQDPTGKIADSFGVRMTGKNMARRVSFLIGKDGVVKHVTANPKAEVHLEEMKDAVAKLNVH